MDNEEFMERERWKTDQILASNASEDRYEMSKYVKEIADELRYNLDYECDYWTFDLPEPDDEFVKMVYLTEEGSKALLEALENSPEPNEALKSLFRNNHDIPWNYRM